MCLEIDELPSGHEKDSQFAISIEFSTMDGFYESGLVTQRFNARSFKG